MSVQELSIDPAHSTVSFAVTFAMNSVVTGRFTNFGGQIRLDTQRPESSTVAAWVDAGSVTTDHEPRDEQLRSDDFLDAGEHQQIRFESTSVEVVGEDHWRVNGELTIRGHTRAVTLDTRYYGLTTDAWGTTRAGFVAEADIQRPDWGINWNEPQETGVLISDHVRVILYISATVVSEVEADDEAEPISGEDESIADEVEPSEDSDDTNE